MNWSLRIILLQKKVSGKMNKNWLKVMRWSLVTLTIFVCVIILSNPKWISGILDSIVDGFKNAKLVEFG